MLTTAEENDEGFGRNMFKLPPIVLVPEHCLFFIFLLHNKTRSKVGSYKSDHIVGMHHRKIAINAHNTEEPQQKCRLRPINNM